LEAEFAVGQSDESLVNLDMSASETALREATASPMPRMSHHSTLIWIAIYILLTSITGAFFMADTVDYVLSVLRHEQGVNFVFWDFRHLLWRPLGWVLFHYSKLGFNYADDAAARAAITHIFIALNWAAGLLSLLLLRRILRRFCDREWAVNFALLTFLFAQGFMNFLHAGSPYVFGLSLLITGMYFLSADHAEVSVRRLFAGALALALSVCFWFPYFFAIPGALAIPLFISRSGWRSTLKAAALCLCLGIVFYGGVILHLHLHTAAAIRTWIATGASDVAGVRGPKRTIFGLARSFINMGQDGVLYKRFLLHDPYNHVSLLQLARLSIFKLAIFYLSLAAIGWALWRSPADRRVLWLGLAGAVPVIAFGLYWYGGDVERYLPLYPFFFLGLACALGQYRAKWMQAIAGLFLATAIVSNLSAMSVLTLRHQERLSEDRLQALLPIYRPHSRVVLVDIHDDLENFSRSFPLLPIINRSDFSFYPALNPATPQTLHWRQDFAHTATTVWGQGGDVWLSKRLFEERPRPDSAWAEGDDPRVKWKDVYNFFATFDLGTPAGGQDGFVLLLPDQKDRELLAAESAVSSSAPVK
jgi:hypothetical protein